MKYVLFWKAHILIFLRRLCRHSQLGNLLTGKESFYSTVINCGRSPSKTVFEQHIQVNSKRYSKRYAAQQHLILLTTTTLSPVDNMVCHSPGILCFTAWREDDQVRRYWGLLVECGSFVWFVVFQVVLRAVITRKEIILWRHNFTLMLQASWWLSYPSTLLLFLTDSFFARWPMHSSNCELLFNLPFLLPSKEAGRIFWDVHRFNGSKGNEVKGW